MSRVHDALRRASTTQPLHFHAVAAPRPVRAAVQERVELPEEVVPEAPLPPKPQRSWGYRLAHRYRVQRVLRFFGVHLGGPTPTCAGVTRQGNPCKGPAMANGFCRLHGGSRYSVFTEKARAILRVEL